MRAQGPRGGGAAREGGREGGAGAPPLPCSKMRNGGGAAGRAARGAGLQRREAGGVDPDSLRTSGFRGLRGRGQETGARRRGRVKAATRPPSFPPRPTGLRPLSRPPDTAGRSPPAAASPLPAPAGPSCGGRSPARRFFPREHEAPSVPSPVYSAPRAGWGCWGL